MTFFKTIKDKLYNYMVVKNSGVRREYRTYVGFHQEEHKKQPWRHWFLLLRLNWHYRIFRKKHSLLLGPESVSIQFPESHAIQRKPVEALIKQLSQYNVVSFDVFDTLVFRPFAKPVDLFSILEVQNGLIGFQKCRRDAEERARNKTTKPNKEINIYDIYEELESSYDINPAQMAKAEMLLETKICYANPYMHAVYEKLVEKGIKIIAVSDMYLPSACIQEILVNCGYDAINTVYVSNEYGDSKESGGLQKVINEKLGSSASVIHVDDNWNCIEGCKKAGWKPAFYRQCNSVGNLYRVPDTITPLESVYKGIVNNYIHCGVNKNSELFEFGFIYGGIAACGYCEWIESFCKLNDCDKVLFLARDTDVFFKLYTKYFNEIPAEYAIVSRNALQELTVDHYTEDFVSHVLYPRIGLGKTLEVFLTECDLIILKAYVADYSLSVDDIICENNCAAVRQLIVDHKKEIAKYYNKCDSAVRDYFKQMIGDSKKICISGLGWVGTEISCLKYLFEEKWNLGVTVVGTNFGSLTHERAVGLYAQGLVTPYAFGDMINRNLTLDASKASEEYYRIGLEDIFSSEDSSLLKYDVDTNGNIKFLKKNDNPNKKYVAEFQKGVLVFVDEFLPCKRMALPNLKISPVEAYEPLYRVFANYDYIRRVLGDMKEMPKAIVGYCSDEQYIPFKKLM